MTIHAESALRLMLDCASLFDHDYNITIVYLVLLLASSQHIYNSISSTCEYDSIDTPLPADVQRPISKSALARATGLPRETVRRKVEKLIEMKLAQPIGGKGFIGTPGMLQSKRSPYPTLRVNALV